jgi:hypothetical protein
VENPAYDQLPREETLVRLLELGQRFGLRRASTLGPACEAERHALEHGHALAFGCCRAAGDLSPSSRPAASQAPSGAR